MLNGKSTGRAEGRYGDGDDELRESLTGNVVTTCAGTEIRARHNVEFLNATSTLHRRNIAAARVSLAGNRRPADVPIVRRVPLVTIVMPDGGANRMARTSESRSRRIAV